MTDFLDNFPLFPIGVIVLPGEIQPLHIFEPRYKQLIRDMEASKGVFGIPYVVDGKICKYGSAVVLHKILAVSPTGEMDILVKGVNIFRLESMNEQMTEKLYTGGSVKILSQINTEPSDELRQKFEEYQHQLARINKLDAKQDLIPQNIHILNIAGQLPLELNEKYSFLKLENQEQREDFLLNKLNFLLVINQKLEEVGYRFYLN